MILFTSTLFSSISQWLSHSYYPFLDCMCGSEWVSHVEMVFEVAGDLIEVACIRMSALAVTLVSSSFNKVPVTSNANSAWPFHLQFSPNGGTIPLVLPWVRSKVTILFSMHVMSPTWAMHKAHWVESSSARRQASLEPAIGMPFLVHSSQSQWNYFFAQIHLLQPRERSCPNEVASKGDIDFHIPQG